MSDSHFPPPLGDELLSSTDRAILGSASGDAPGPDGKANLLRALGAAGVIGAATASVGTATVGTATTGTALGASTKGAIGAATFLKIGGAVAIVGALAGGAWTATHPAEPVETAPVPVTTAPVMAAPHASPDPRERAPVPVASAAPSPTTPLLVPPLPVVSRSAPRPVTSVAPIAPPVSSGEPPTTASPSNATHDLEEEARALATARQSLAHGDNRGALEALDRYDAQYPDGQLRPEASILRARATTPAR